MFWGTKINRIAGPKKLETNFLLGSKLPNFLSWEQNPFSPYPLQLKKQDTEYRHPAVDHSMFYDLLDQNLSAAYRFPHIYLEVIDTRRKFVCIDPGLSISCGFQYRLSGKIP